VRLGFGDGGLRVEVDDDGTSRGTGQPSARANGSGHGIAGMTERAAALGGSLEAGPRPEGGFGVRAWLPARRRPGDGRHGDGLTGQAPRDGRGQQ
jgi:signal transduction histidine kinase